MTYTKEMLSRAFEQVLRQSVPDVSGIPDHVFSARFESRMERLLRREAAHPWAVSHTAARNLLVAALITVLLLTLAFSVGAIRDPIFNFFLRHFQGYDEVVFDESPRTEIEHIYEITALPEGFVLTESIEDPDLIIKTYYDVNNNFIDFEQRIPKKDYGAIVDNEKPERSTIEINGIQVYTSIDDFAVLLAWGTDGYEFWLIIHIPGYTLDQAISLMQSIK